MERATGPHALATAMQDGRVQCQSVTCCRLDSKYFLFPHFQTFCDIVIVFFKLYFNTFHKEFHASLLPGPGLLQSSSLNPAIPAAHGVRPLKTCCHTASRACTSAETGTCGAGPTTVESARGRQHRTTGTWRLADVSRMAGLHFPGGCVVV